MLNSSPVLKMKTVVTLLYMLCLCGAQKWRQDTSAREPKEHAKTCSNLTQVLSNWKFAIITQVKNMLVNDHALVLPEYSRIQPLSNALGELYNKFSSLKEELGRLTMKFDRVETFVDDLQAGKFIPPSRPMHRIHGNIGLRTPLLAQVRETGRRSVSRPVPVRVRERRIPHIP